MPSGDGGHLSKRVLDGLRGFGLWEDKGSGGHFCGLDNVLILNCPYFDIRYDRGMVLFLSWSMMVTGWPCLMLLA